MADNLKLVKFLKLVPNANWRGNVPRVWNAELREAFSSWYVKVGFGCRLELTDEGRALLEGYKGKDDEKKGKDA